MCLQNLVHEKEHKIPKKLDHLPESGSVNPPNDPSTGLLGQVISNLDPYLSYEIPRYLCSVITYHFFIALILFFTSQVMKVAVIVGFGVLVLLTRQKEPRYV